MAIQNLVPANSPAFTGRMYNHNYVCPSLDCLKSANPMSGSWHQRNVNLPTDKPRKDVKCPGCGKAMIIGGGDMIEDADGNIKKFTGPWNITEVPEAGHPDQSGDASIFIAKEDE